VVRLRSSLALSPRSPRLWWRPPGSEC
jgi:hypothetical protein